MYLNPTSDIPSDQIYSWIKETKPNFCSLFNIDQVNTNFWATEAHKYCFFAFFSLLHSAPILSSSSCELFPWTLALWLYVQCGYNLSLDASSCSNKIHPPDPTGRGLSSDPGWWRSCEELALAARPSHSWKSIIIGFQTDTFHLIFLAERIQIFRTYLRKSNLAFASGKPDSKNKDCYKT